jgi:caa(3)-type oxidase subunit IV
MTIGSSDRRYLWRGPLMAWIALMVLFVISLASAYVPLGIGNLTANLFIAAIMVIVLAIFLMDIRNAKFLIRIIAAAGLFWTSIMLYLTFSDYFTR